jgi:hypothetical protein
LRLRESRYAWRNGCAAVRQSGASWRVVLDSATWTVPKRNGDGASGW